MGKKQYLTIVAALILIAIVIAYWYARRDFLGPAVNGFDEAEQSNQNVVTSGDNPQPGGIHDLPVPPGVAVARAALAGRLLIGTKDVLILTAFEKEWPNSCLGLEKEGEFCAQVIVPGFEVTMQVEGRTYIYRTNVDGSAVAAVN